MGIATWGGRPLNGSKVKITTLNGKNLPTIGKARTNVAGGFQLRVKQRLPKAFVVKVSGGRAHGKKFKKTYLSIGTPTMPGEFVNELTTVAAQYRAARSAKPAAAATRILRLISVPLDVKAQRMTDLGVRGSIVSTRYDSRTLLAKARRGGGFSKYSKKLVRKAARKPAATVDFTSRQSRSRAPMGMKPLRGAASTIASKAAEIALSAARNAAAANNCVVPYNPSPVGTFAGCDADQLQMQEDINNLESALLDMEDELADLEAEFADLQAATALEHSQLQHLIDNLNTWNVNNALLATVVAQPLRKMGQSASIEEICDAAFPDPTSANGQDQTPDTLCKDNDGYFDAFTQGAGSQSWALFEAITGYQTPQTDMLFPAFQQVVTDTDTRTSTGEIQNQLNTLFANIIAVGANAFGSAVSWASFVHNWTYGEPEICNTPLPSSYPDPDAYADAIPATLSGPCLIASTGLFQLSVETHMMNTGPSATILDDNIIEPKTDTAYWAYPFDASGATVHSNPEYPFYPGFEQGSSDWYSADIRTISDHSKWTGQPTTENPYQGYSSTPFQLIYQSSEQFRVADPTTASSLVDFISDSSAYKAEVTNHALNDGLRLAGFKGVGLGEGETANQNGAGMWWAHLGSGMTRGISYNTNSYPLNHSTQPLHYENDPGVKCSTNWKKTGDNGWPESTGGTYSCAMTGDTYSMDSYGKAYTFNPTYSQETSSNSDARYSTVNPCPHPTDTISYKLEGWPKNPFDDDESLFCTGPEFVGDAAPFGLLVNASVKPMWTSAKVTAWQDGTVEALSAGPVATTNPASFDPATRVLTLRATVAASINRADATTYAIGFDVSNDDVIPDPFAAPKNYKFINTNVTSTGSDLRDIVYTYAVPAGVSKINYMAVVQDAADPWNLEWNAYGQVLSIDTPDLGRSQPSRDRQARSSQKAHSR